VRAGRTQLKSEAEPQSLGAQEQSQSLRSLGALELEEIRSWCFLRGTSLRNGSGFAGEARSQVCDRELNGKTEPLAVG